MLYCYPAYYCIFPWFKTLCVYIICCTLLATFMHLAASSIHSEFSFRGSMHTAQLRQVREHLPVFTHKALIAILSLMLLNTHNQ